MLIAAFFVGSPLAGAQQKSKGYNELAAEVLKYVNEHRATKGLAPLKMVEVISQAAEKHSRNMAGGRLPFGHDGFDERMNGLVKQLRPANSWAENVAYSNDDARDVVNMWLHSPGHKKNIEGKFNITGIGIAVSPGGDYYYTQIFVNKE